jgi:hypothetical protein
MRFLANLDGTILPQSDIELLCEARGSLTASVLNYFEIRDYSVHRVFRANLFAIVHKFVENKFGGRKQGGSRLPKDPRLSAYDSVISVFVHLNMVILHLLTTVVIANQ